MHTLIVLGLNAKQDLRPKYPLIYSRPFHKTVQSFGVNGLSVTLNGTKPTSFFKLIKIVHGSLSRIIYILFTYLMYFHILYDIGKTNNLH